MSADFEIAGLKYGDRKFPVVYGRPEGDEPTGGLPVIPDDATNKGKIDPAEFPPGTIITVVTESISKWVMTVDYEGFVTIEHFNWNARLLKDKWESFNDSKANYDRYLEDCEAVERLRKEYPGLQINGYSAPYKPFAWHVGRQRVNRPFGAGDRMSFDIYNPKGPKPLDGASGLVAYWSIEHPSPE